MQLRSFLVAFLLLAVTLVAFSTHTPIVSAQTADEIQQQIAEHNKKIADLDAEIAAYQKQLSALGSQHQTLATSISSLDTQRKALTTKIKSLQQQIATLNLELKKLGYLIADKQQSISLNKRTLAQSLRDIDASDTSTLVEQVFSSNDLSTAWAAVDESMALNEALRDHTQQLAEVKQQLTTQQQAVSATQAKLVTVTTDLGTQKKAVDVTVTEKNKLLTQTKSQESTYQQLIATKKAQQKVFEAALNSLESKLKSVGTASIPRTGTGILAWPTRAHTITQYFGKTAFAASGAYNGNGHNGIDIGIPTGTPIYAALSGVVMGTGNTDAIPGCYSFGKWVAIKHANGLATVYAHLSQINVSKGQTLDTGQALGFSGMTGYATGPHLHFGVYAVGTADAPGIQITTLSAARGATSPCANATMPVAPLNAYLDPMSYL